MSTSKSVAGKWGPIAYAVSPVSDNEMLSTASNDLWKSARVVYETAREKADQHDRHMDGSKADKAVGESLWSEYEELMREYKVLLGWHYATQAAYLFVVNGCGSQYLDGVFEIELVELPDVEASL